MRQTYMNDLLETLIFHCLKLALVAGAFSFAAPSSLVGQELPQEVTDKSLRSAFVEYVNSVAELKKERASEDGKEDNDEFRQVREDLLVQEDLLLSLAGKTDPATQAVIQLAVANSRLALGHRSAIPLAVRAIASGHESTMSLLLHAGRFSQGIRLVTHDRENIRLQNRMKQLEHLVETAGPDIRCTNDQSGDLCRSLKLLLVLPPLVDNLKIPAPRRESNPRLVNVNPLLQFVYDPIMARKMLGRLPAPPEYRWQGIRLSANRATTLATLSSTLEGTRLNATKLLEALWQELPIREALLGNDTGIKDKRFHEWVVKHRARFLGTPSSTAITDTDDDSDVIVSLEEALTMRGRTYLIIKIMGSGGQGWSFVELPTLAKPELWAYIATVDGEAIQRLRIRDNKLRIDTINRQALANQGTKV
jgi:hypothetical protein